MKMSIFDEIIHKNLEGWFCGMGTRSSSHFVHMAGIMGWCVSVAWYVSGMQVIFAILRLSKDCLFLYRARYYE